jgi:hypothetical protein
MRTLNRTIRRFSGNAAYGKSSAVPSVISREVVTKPSVPFDVAEARRVVALSEAREDAHVEEALKRKVTIFKQGVLLFKPEIATLFSIKNNI